MPCVLLKAEEITSFTIVVLYLAETRKTIMSWNPDQGQGQDPNQPSQYGGYSGYNPPPPQPTDPYSGQQSGYGQQGGYQQGPYQQSGYQQGSPGQEQYNQGGYQQPYGAAPGAGTGQYGPSTMQKQRK